MKNLKALSATMLIIIVGSFGLKANAEGLNNHVNAFIKQILAQDDYVELIGFEEPNEEVFLDNRDSSTDVGLRSKHIGQKIYFYYSGDVKIYNLSTESWESDIVMQDPVSAFEVDEFGIYIAHERAVYYYPFDLSPRVFFGNLQADVREMTLMDGYLLVYSNQFNSFDVNSGVQVDSSNVFYRPNGSVAVPSINKIISRNTGVSPCDIVEMSVDTNGQIGNQSDSQYHGDYPCSNSVYLFPDGARVVDGAGIIYHASTLIYAGSLAGSLDHVDFYVGLPIVLRGDTLYSYSNVMVETGQYTFNENKHVHAVFEDNVFVFDYEVSGVGVEKIHIDLISPVTPGQPVDPNGLVYTPNVIEYNGGNQLFLLDSGNLSIHVFNANTMTYDESIALVEAPLFMSHSHNNNKLYLAYSDGRIGQIDLDNSSHSVLVNSPQTPCGLATFDDKIFVCDPSGAWVSHFTYSSTGELISQVEWNYYSEKYKWSDENRKMYHFRDGTSPNDLFWESIDQNGVIQDNMDSPYHRSGWTYPLCVNPSGADVLIGNGTLFDAITLVESNFLSNSIRGCAWANGQLFTLDDTVNTTDLQSWSPAFQEQFEAQFSGEPLDLIGLESGALIVIYLDQGIPQFAIHNDIIFNNAFE